jgi:parallel beta-helix repeat protein
LAAKDQVKRRALIAAAAVAVPGAAAAQAADVSGAMVRPEGGTNARTLAALLGTVHDVKNFGAAGDGGTDDTAAIQATLTHAAWQGGSVFIPDGIYLISGALAVDRPNLRIIGASWNAKLVRAPGNNAQLLALYGPGCFVSTLAIDGNGPSDAAGGELSLAGADSEAANILVLNSRKVAIGIAADRCTVRDCTIVGLADPDIQSYGVWADNNNAGTMIRDNHITNTGIDGIGVGGDGFQVIGNYLANCHAHIAIGGGQIVVYNDAGKTRNGLILGNQVAAGNSPVSGGIELNGQDITVVGNSINDQKFFGIAIDSGGGFLFEANTISNCGTATPGTDVISYGAGIAIPPGTSDFKISGNRFIDDQAVPTTTCGVLVNEGDSNTYSIVNNTFSGHRFAAVIDGGQGGQKLIRDNLGIDDVIPRLAAAATILLPLNPVIRLTGTARITALTGPLWPGRAVTILPDADLVFSPGGNFANTLTAPAHTPVTAVFDGALWFLK